MMSSEARDFQQDADVCSGLCALSKRLSTSFPSAEWLWCDGYSLKCDTLPCRGRCGLQMEGDGMKCDSLLGDVNQY